MSWFWAESLKHMQRLGDKIEMLNKENNLQKHSNIVAWGMQ